jgi:hypothetical protein
MTTHRFGAGLSFAFLAAVLLAPCAAAQQTGTPPTDAAPKPGKLIRAGDVLSGELNAMRMRDAKKGGKRVATYQITSEPRRLPPPNGLCNLETGPETFQLVTTSEAQANQLRSLAGKEISVKVDEIACAQDAGQMSEAIVTKWSVVAK